MLFLSVGLEKKRELALQKSIQLKVYISLFLIMFLHVKT